MVNNFEFNGTRYAKNELKALQDTVVYPENIYRSREMHY